MCVGVFVSVGFFFCRLCYIGILVVVWLFFVLSCVRMGVLSCFCRFMVLV